MQTQKCRFKNADSEEPHVENAEDAKNAVVLKIAANAEGGDGGRPISDLEWNISYPYGGLA